MHVVTESLMRTLSGEVHTANKEFTYTVSSCRLQEVKNKGNLETIREAIRTKGGRESLTRGCNSDISSGATTYICRNYNYSGTPLIYGHQWAKKVWP